MLRFSSSVGACPILRATSRSPTNPSSLRLGKDPVGFRENRQQQSLQNPDPPLRPEDILDDSENESNQPGWIQDSDDAEITDARCTSEARRISDVSEINVAPETPDTRCRSDVSERTVDVEANNILDESEIAEDTTDVAAHAKLQHQMRISPKFTLRQKKKIVWEAFSKAKHVRATARKYKISHGSIYHWKSLFERASSEQPQNVQHLESNSRGLIGAFYHRYHQDDDDGFGTKDKNRITNITIPTSAGGKLTVHSGPQCRIPLWAQVHLSRYFDHLRSLNQRVAISDMCTEYMTICPSDTEELSYTALRQRVYRWVKSVNIVDRAVTHQAQKGDYCLQRINDWVAFIRQQIEVYNIKEENVVNFDETNVDFTLEAKRTLDRKGARTVQSVSASSSSRATVMLGVSMTGHKFPPYVIFKGKRGGRIEERELANPTANDYPSGMILTVQGNAWMDEQGMLLWIEKVWEPFVKSRPEDDLFLLILDEFKGHTVGSVMHRLAELRTLVEIIPGGYTGKLQVMDVGINRPFKATYGEEHFSFLRFRHSETPPGTRIIPWRQDVASWISTAWKAVKEESITKTWVHIGIRDPPLRPIDYIDDIEETRIQLGAEAFLF
ncbi:hypothetical protein ACA910_009512 [Epithemia clementina (nom. ined.)]